MPPKKNVLNRLKKICEKEIDNINEQEALLAEEKDEEENEQIELESKNCYYCKKEITTIMNTNGVEIPSCNCSVLNKKVRYPKRMNIETNGKPKVEKTKKKLSQKEAHKQFIEKIKEVKKLEEEQLKTTEKSVYEDLYEKFTNTTLN